MPWHNKTIDGYSRDSTEAIDNAKMIYSILSGLGWTLNAVCGVLGNMGYESNYNPWRWQGDDILSSGDSPWNDHGYGLVQFTNTIINGTQVTKYLSNGSSYTGYGPAFSDTTPSSLEGQAQMNYLNSEADYYSRTAWPLTYSQYKISTLSPEYLAKTWLHNYERPSNAGTTVENNRASEARYWWNTLSGTSPEEPTTGEYSVSILIVGNGTASASPSTNLSGGETITLTENPASGSSFKGWTVIIGGIAILNNSFTMPETNVIIQADFSGSDPYITTKKSKWIYYMRPAWVR